MEYQHASRGAVLAALLCAPAFAQAPAGATHYSIDQAKSSLEFSFVQAGAQNKGKFTKFPVTLDASADGTSASRLDVTVDMTTFDTDDKERNDTLKGPDLFDVAKFPQAHFVATQITKTATGFDAVGKREEGLAGDDATLEIDAEAFGASDGEKNVFRDSAICVSVPQRGV